MSKCVTNAQIKCVRISHRTLRAENGRRHHGSHCQPGDNYRLSTVITVFTSITAYTAYTSYTGFFSIVASTIFTTLAFITAFTSITAWILPPTNDTTTFYLATQDTSTKQVLCSKQVLCYRHGVAVCGYFLLSTHPVHKIYGIYDCAFSCPSILIPRKAVNLRSKPTS